MTAGSRALPMCQQYSQSLACPAQALSPTGILGPGGDRHMRASGQSVYWDNLVVPIETTILGVTVVIERHEDRLE